MKIVSDVKLGTYTFVPKEKGEQEILSTLVKSIKPGEKLKYEGCSQDNREKKDFRIVHLTGPNNLKLILAGSTREDRFDVNNIRNLCFFGSGGLIFLGAMTVGDKTAIVVTGKYCKLCGAAMIDWGASEWSTCDACAAKCTHKYVRHVVHGPKVDMDVADFCTICGRTKTKLKQRSRLERHLAVERELGLSIVYKDTMLTPSQVAHIRKMAAAAPHN